MTPRKNNGVRVTLQSTITIGQKVWTVEGITGEELLLMSGSEWMRLTLRGLLASSSVRVDGVAIKAVGDLSLDYYPPHQVARVRTRIEHLNEIEEGYKSGTPLEPLRYEPRPQFDKARTSKEERVANKAAELNCSPRLLHYQIGAVRDGALGRLADGRSLQPAGPDPIDPAVVTVLRAVAARYTFGSTTSQRGFYFHVRLALYKKFGRENVGKPGTPPDPARFRVICPSEHRVMRWLAQYQSGAATFKAATLRRSEFESTQNDLGRGGLASLRPGQFVLFDVLHAPIFAVDSVTFEWNRVYFLATYDAFTHRVPAMRLTVGEPKKTDVIMVFRDLVVPATRRPWQAKPRVGDDQRPYIGWPEEVWVSHARTWGVDDPAEKPTLPVEEIILDRAKANLSRHVREAATEIGIDIGEARPRTPGDKSEIENYFRTMVTQFFEWLQGFKGRNVEHRGARPETEAYYFNDELEDRFWQWHDKIWCNEESDGLRLPEFPHKRFSPNLMQTIGTARAGLHLLPPRQDLFYALLPTHWHAIDRKGIRRHGLVYNDPVLDAYRRPSPHPSRKWPVKQDQRDVLRLWLHDIENERYIEIPWIKAYRIAFPVSETVLRTVKALLTDQRPDGYPRLTQDDIVEGMIDIHEGVFQGTLNRRTSRTVRRSLEEGKRARKDQKDNDTLKRNVDASLDESGEVPDDDLDPDDYGASTRAKPHVEVRPRKTAATKKPKPPVVAPEEEPDDDEIEAYKWIGRPDSSAD